jgi:hypothetical protein
MPEKWTKWMRWAKAKCPHCGVPNDLTAFDYLLIPDNQKPVFACERKVPKKDEFGNEYEEDIGCGKRFQIVAVDRPVLVRLRKSKADAGEFTHVQTDEERAEFEAGEVWAEMNKDRGK